MPIGNASLRRHNATKALFGINLSGQHPRFFHGLNPPASEKFHSCGSRNLRNGKSRPWPLNECGCISNHGSNARAPKLRHHIETEAAYSRDASRRIRVAHSQTIQARDMESLELN